MTAPPTKSPSSSLESRIRGAFYALAVTDALGAPVEFQRRGTFPLVTSMLFNTNFKIYNETTQRDEPIPPGSFTDDTSTALCLAHSLLDSAGQNDPIDQVRKYLAWFKYGYMSSVNECFDIGNATSSALKQWSGLLKTYDALLDHTHPDSPAATTMRTDMQSKVSERLNKDNRCGNGSLMRVLPCALIASTEDHAVNLAAESSKTTHPHPRCIDACVLYTRLICSALHGATKGEICEYLITLLSSDIEPQLKQRLEHYRRFEDWVYADINEISSSGYVVDTLEAALWAFFTTNTYKDGAIRVVNLGDDADTVGAGYGGLAGAFYGFESIPADWLGNMKAMEKVEDVVQKILLDRGTPAATSEVAT